MKNDSRVAVGLLMIILGCVVVLYSISQIIPQVSSHSLADESTSEQWGSIVTTLWMMLSLTVKLMMVMGKRAKWVNFSSIIGLFIVGIVLYSLPDDHPQTMVHYSGSLVFFALLFLFSWYIVDIIDIKRPKQTT